CNKVEGGNFVENGGYQLCDGPGDGDIEPGSYSYGYLKEELIDKNGYTSYWNEAAQVPFLYNDELGEFVSYDDVQSIQAKVDYVKEKGLAGAMIWEINQDDAAGSLLQTVSTGLD